MDRRLNSMSVQNSSKDSTGPVILPPQNCDNRRFNEWMGSRLETGGDMKRNVGVGQVIENERILELPLNGRQATDLIVLAGAAVQTAAANPDRNMNGSVAITVAGGLKTGTAYLLDGAMHNDPYDNYNLP